MTSFKRVVLQFSQKYEFLLQSLSSIQSGRSYEVKLDDSYSAKAGHLPVHLKRALVIQNGRYFSKYILPWTLVWTAIQILNKSVRSWLTRKDFWYKIHGPKDPNSHRTVRCEPFEVISPISLDYCDNVRGSLIPVSINYLKYFTFISIFFISSL